VEVKAVGYSVVQLQQKGFQLYVTYPNMQGDKEMIQLIPQGDSFRIEKAKLKQPELGIYVRPKQGQPEVLMFNLK
jgi:hypothetical protein